MKDTQLLKKINGQSLPVLIVIMSVVYAFLAYFPFIGHCFVGDDYFRLVDNSQDKFDLLNLGTDGFFRPINHLSFFLSIKIAGYKPFFYGCFNFALYLSILALGYFVFTKVLGSKLYASLVILFWAINFKIAEATLLGMVGRTELLWVFFALLALTIFLSRLNFYISLLPFCICMLLALLSKETAVVMVFVTPLVLKLSGLSSKKALFSFVAALLAIAAYFYLRNQTAAWGINNAPSFYAYNFGIGHLFLRTCYYILNGVGLSLIPCLLLLFFRRSFGINKNALILFFISLIILAPTIPLPNKSYLYVFFAVPFMVAGFLMCLKEVEKIERGKLIAYLSLVLICFLPFSQHKFVKSLLRDYTVQALVNNVEAAADGKTVLKDSSRADLQYAIKVKELSH